YKWLQENAYKYGFILRSPENKESITGYTFMPWHYRYVGKDTAEQIHEAGNDTTFEEFFGLKGGDYEKTSS
ncbi:MAG: D-alanyl-D-alanine carboxypeptidase family protein, partial [Parvimonas sp.]|nr:D-alanyl-D-alanine carboxypeptidase family protein [Parvimonas sp.]